MKKKLLNIYTISSLAALTLGLSSCDDYLDKLPDNRMSITNVSEANKLLVSAYPGVYPAMLTEMYSDNADAFSVTGWTTYDRFQTEAWSWGDITDTSNDDSPQSLWDHYYIAISSANEALDFANKDSVSYATTKGEALLCRAYNVFMLSNVFCNAYDAATASKQLGIPYPEHTQKTYKETYTRGTLEETYQKIDRDLQKGIGLVGNTYDQPKFHFTKNSAYAFAARFYLYYQKYDKAIYYASKVLGSDPSSMLRDWKSMSSLSANGQIQPNVYIDADNSCNLLLNTVLSVWGVVGQNYGTGNEYAHGSYLSSTETFETAGPWGNGGSRFNFSIFKNSSLSKVCLRKIPYSFEYSDIQAGIGNAHSEFAVFNTDLLLMERAEAYALSGNYEAAIADINTELSVLRKTSSSVTLKDIQDFYKSINYYTPTDPTPKKAFHTSFAIDSVAQEPVLQAVLQLKRLVTMHEGIRLQDVKRYGITIYRRTLDANNDVIAVSDTLSPNDPRRAIQLPQDAISAGIEANPRTK